MVSTVSFFLPIWKRSDNFRKQVGYKPTSGTAKGGFFSESAKRFLDLQISKNNIPKRYPELEF